jgi:DNA-nicking Smr family endonuclease
MDKKITDEVIESEEQQLFRQAMKGVKPLKHDKVRLRKKRPLPIRKPVTPEAEPALFWLSDNQSQESVSITDKLFFTRPGLSPKQIQQLKRGKVAIEATLDLHGHNTDSAREKLIAFIGSNFKQGHRYVSIIHGKGFGDHPVLKNKLNNWLREIDQVLAFVSAHPRHGGTGALYVLLRSALK